VKITLDFPPSANRYWRHDRGVTHRSAEANAYRDNVALLCMTAGITPLNGDIKVCLLFFRPAKRGDLDNLFKVVLDALQGFAYHNDSQIAEIHAIRYDDKLHPGVNVEVMQL
jgi:crossover junction endodeoxyribonuclease RusA